MRQFAIVTDSCGDLGKNLREKYQIDYVPMRFNYDDVDVPASLDWEFVPVKDFYNLMRNGKRIKTSQVNAEEYRKNFGDYLENGMDVLYISCSSALSASYHTSLLVRDELLKAHPEAKIICVDSLNSCLGLGLICIAASKLRAQGKSVDEVADYVKENRLKMNQFATVEDLAYLKRAGRVSTASAVFGGLFQVKPIIISDARGNNYAIEKVKGRKKSIERIAEMFKETYDENGDFPTIGIAHADSEADADLLAAAVIEKLGKKNVEVITSYIGPIVGASTGPGTIAVFPWCVGVCKTFS